MENSNIIIYQTEDGDTKIDVRLDNETVWLTQKLMAELFQTTPQNITIHLRNIFEEGELDEISTCKDFLQVQKEGKRTVKRKQLLLLLYRAHQDLLLLLKFVLDDSFFKNKIMVTNIQKYAG